MAGTHIRTATDADVEAASRVSQTWVMEIQLADERRTADWPEDYTVRTFRPDDAEAVKTLLDLAYAAEPDFHDQPFEDWRRVMLGDASFEPESWILALAPDGTLAGAALNWREGFVKDLVVHPDHRGRGLGQALMLHTFTHFRERGQPRVSLKTDSRNTSQAWRFYERLGMRKTRTYDDYAKQNGVTEQSAGQ